MQRRSIPFPTVGDSWLEWATKQCGSSAAAVELSYNIFDVCGRFQHDPDCKLFLKITSGDLCELAVADQRQSVEALQQLCYNFRRPGHTVLITKHDFFKAIRIVFPGKSRDHMDKLRFVLALEKTGESFDFRPIFAEDGDKSQTRFMEVLRKQHIDELEFFAMEVIEALRALVASDGKLCVADAMNTYAEIDPQATESEIHQIFSTACRLTLPDLLGAEHDMKVDGEVVLNRLRMHVLLKRAGPPSSSEIAATDADAEEDA